MTYTFPAASTNAVLFITVLGLTENEMPIEKFRKIILPGLSVGGGGVTVVNTVAGIVVFMRMGTVMDVTYYKLYLDTILLPFLIKLEWNFIEGRRMIIFPHI